MTAVSRAEEEAGAPASRRSTMTENGRLAAADCHRRGLHRRTGHRRRTVSSSRDSRQTRRSGRSSGFRFVLLAAPSHGILRSGLWQRSSPVTAAGPQRIYTVFPILLPDHKSRQTPVSVRHRINRPRDVKRRDRTPDRSPDNTRSLCSEAFTDRSAGVSPAGAGLQSEQRWCFGKHHGEAMQPRHSPQQELIA